jgi:radical SAM superfamily enzyme YgiQ (UPF0313 family)
MKFSFEQGPIRPPSEAKSLLIRVTRSCPWNKCAFCHTYRGAEFSLRTLEEIRSDIQTAADIRDEIRALSWRLGEGGRISEPILHYVYDDRNAYGSNFRFIAAWLFYGAESVFLQDANSLIVKTDELANILQFLREKFHTVRRITTYGRSKTAARKPVEDFIKLKEAGLSRIHIGMESGYDPLLVFIKKGVTAQEHIEGGRRIRQSGISLSEYVMPGLGGKKWSREHAVESARVINEINPDFIRLRTLQVVPGTDLESFLAAGEFQTLSDDEILKEIYIFISSLHAIESTLTSDHILNLLEELSGKLPEDRDRLLTTIDRYFSLSDEEKLVYRFGRRRGIYRSLGDLSDSGTYARLKDFIEQQRLGEPGKMEEHIAGILKNYI